MEMRRKWLDRKRAEALVPDAVWVRRHPGHESAIVIVKVITHGLMTKRCLVQGRDSGRQWLVSFSTLMDAYDPEEKP